MIAGNGSIPATLAHYMPGRVRIKLDPGCNTRKFVDELESQIRSVPGILGVECREMTRSVVVRFNPDLLDMTTLIELGKSANLIAADGGELVLAQKNAPVSQGIATQKQQSMGVNWDMLVPVFLLGLSLKAVYINGRRTSGAMVFAALVCI
jgi:hypothetical protein